ncbi:MAG: queuosine precursor transporter [Alphaproteobacteria bacterium]
MSNELLFALALFGGLTISLGAFYLGRIFVFVLMITISLYLGITEAKVIEVFGWPTTIGTALFGVLMLSTDMLSERYGRKAAFEVTFYSIFAVLCFQLFIKITLLAEATPDMQFMADAMGTVYTTSFRMVFAGIFVFMVSQSLDIVLFYRIRKITGEKWLWARNKGSTIVSQGVDTYLFTFLAFYGLFDDWVLMATTNYCFKLVVAFSDTFFIYASKYITPRDLKTQQALAA